MKYEFDYSSIKVYANFTSKVSVLLDDSGTGKTFLFTMLVASFMGNNIKFAKLDSEHKELPEGKYDVILCDNADLYMNNELYTKLKDSCNELIICIKDITLVDMRDIKIYGVNYLGKSLEAYCYG